MQNDCRCQFSPRSVTRAILMALWTAPPLVMTAAPISPAIAHEIVTRSYAWRCSFVLVSAFARLRSRSRRCGYRGYILAFVYSELFWFMRHWFGKYVMNRRGSPFARFQLFCFSVYQQKCLRLLKKGLNKLNKPIKKRDHNSSVFLRSFTTCLTKGNVRNLCKCLTRRLKDDLERVQPFLRTLNTFLVLSSRIVANWHQYHSYCIVLFLFFLFFWGDMKDNYRSSLES